MSINVLNAVSEAMKTLGLNYEFGEWTGDIAYPYWVGEYQETEPVNEDGMQETSFLLTGFTRSKYISLENDREKIEKLFNKISGYRASYETSQLAIFYASTLANLPTGDAELKKIEVNLLVKEWRVI